MKDGWNSVLGSATGTVARLRVSRSRGVAGRKSLPSVTEGTQLKVEAVGETPTEATETVALPAGGSALSPEGPRGFAPPRLIQASGFAEDC